MGLSVGNDVDSVLNVRKSEGCRDSDGAFERDGMKGLFDKSSVGILVDNDEGIAVVIEVGDTLTVGDGKVGDKVTVANPEETVGFSVGNEVDVEEDEDDDPEVTVFDGAGERVGASPKATVGFSVGNAVDMEEAVGA